MGKSLNKPVRCRIMIYISRTYLHLTFITYITLKSVVSDIAVIAYSFNLLLHKYGGSHTDGPITKEHHSMIADIDQPKRLKRTSRHPLWLSILACYSLL